MKDTEISDTPTVSDGAEECRHQIGWDDAGGCLECGFHYREVIDDLQAEVQRLTDFLVEHTWAVGHPFTPDPIYPDDGACVFAVTDHGGLRECEVTEEDTVTKEPSHA